LGKRGEFGSEGGELKCCGGGERRTEATGLLRESEEGRGVLGGERHGGDGHKEGG